MSHQQPDNKDSDDVQHETQPAEEWGERAFQVRDPNGVIVQLVDWNGATAG